MPPSPQNPSPSVDSASAAAVEGVQHVSVKSLMLGSGPRFARDAFGPILVFYVGWKLFGLGIGIGAATLMSLLSWRYEKRRDRSARMALFALGFVLFQAAVGLVSGSATVYLAQPVLLSGGFGLAFIVSVVVRRPLAGFEDMNTLRAGPGEIVASLGNGEHRIFPLSHHGLIRAIRS